MRRIVTVLAAAAAIVGCSSSSLKTASSSPTAGTSTTTILPGINHTASCRRPVASRVRATRVVASTSDYDVTSFDGTRIRAHWFPLGGAKPAPTVLKGPGWGQAGDTNTAGSGYGLFGDLGIDALHHAGYNVLTWDPRGFGQSNGTVETDSPDYEGRDVSALIDWLSTQPGVQLDAEDDPRMGMVGASYGGGIQLTVASIDCRVDAIVPQLAWHSLGTSLYKADTAKTGWGDLLYGVAATHTLDPHITSAHSDSDASGVITPDDAAWFVSRGPGDDVDKITAPTLLEQGTIDTLFSLDEAATNYKILTDNGVPTAMLWMCSGHGVCLTEPGDQQLPGTAALQWLDRYVKGDSAAKPVPVFEYVDQNGAEHTAGEYPPPGGDPITADGRGALTFEAGGGSGPAVATGTVGALGGVALPITPARANHAADIPITFARHAFVLGAPQLTLRYAGTSPAGERPTRVFAQLVDDASGIVVGNQITPIEVTLDGREHTVETPLEMIAFTAEPGARLTLQLVATTVAYAEPRLGGRVEFSSVHISLPTVTGVTSATSPAV
jgi:ABC-2 type transport system ATP-binding protein